MATCSMASAQQQGIYSQVQNGAMFYNPAFAGLEYGGILSLGHRTQWAGINASPVQQYISYATRLRKNWIDTISPNALILSNPHLYNSQKKAVQKTKALPIGIGVDISTDAIGPFERFDSKLNFAYHFKTENDFKVSLGAGLGFSYLNIILNQLWVLENGDEVFIEYKSDNSNTSFLNSNVGIIAYNKNFYMGLSATQIFDNQPFNDYGDVSNYHLRNHFIINGSYIHQINKEWQIAPTVAIFAVNGVPPSISIGAKMRYKSKVWFGLNYRIRQAVNVKAGLMIKNRFALSYAYELSTGTIAAYQFGTHELGFTYLFNNQKALKHLW